MLDAAEAGNALPAASDPMPFASGKESGVRDFSALSALTEPGAFAAPKAFKSYDPARRGAKSRRAVLPEPGQMETVPAIPSETAVSEGASQNTDSETSGTVSGDPETEQKKTAPAISSEAEVPDGAFRNTVSETSGTVSGDPETEQRETGPEMLSEADPELDIPKEASSPDLPPFERILQNAFRRSDSPEDENVIFTFDEIVYLAADPDFNRVYPDQAAQMHAILRDLDSG